MQKWHQTKRTRGGGSPGLTCNSSTAFSNGARQSSIDVPQQEPPQIGDFPSKEHHEAIEHLESLIKSDMNSQVITPSSKEIAQFIRSFGLDLIEPFQLILYFSYCNSIHLSFSVLK